MFKFNHWVPHKLTQAGDWCVQACANLFKYQHKAKFPDPIVTYDEKKDLQKQHNNFYHIHHINQHHSFGLLPFSPTLMVLLFILHRMYEVKFICIWNWDLQISVPKTLKNYQNIGRKIRFGWWLLPVLKVLLSCFFPTLLKTFFGRKLSLQPNISLMSNFF